jgi:hypothetical protein
MGKPIGQTVIKGMTIDTHLKTKEGRALLAWVVGQPVVEDPLKPFLAPWVEKRNSYIRERMGEFEKTVEMVVGRAEVATAPQRTQINGISEAQGKLIIDKLDTILDLLSENGKSWDESK